MRAVSLFWQEQHKLTTTKHGNPEKRRGGGEGGVLMSCMVAVVVPPLTLASLQCRDGARQLFIDQAGIACTKREAP